MKFKRIAGITCLISPVFFAFLFTVFTLGFWKGLVCFLITLTLAACVLGLVGAGVHLLTLADKEEKQEEEASEEKEE